MNGRRLLGETLGEIAGGALDMAPEAARLVRVTAIELDLPIDIRIARDGAEAVLVGDVPLFHWRTDFDPPPARLQVSCTAVPLAEFLRVTP